MYGPPKTVCPPAKINAIVQTPDGFLWLATEAGLVRFDGDRFKIFDSRNTPGLRRDNITALLVTHQGGLWIGTDGAGFGPFMDGKFSSLRTGIKDESWSDARTFLEARDGSLWIGGGGEHNLLHYKDGSFTNVKPDYQGVRGFVQDPAGTIWAGSLYSGLFAHHANGAEATLDQKQGVPPSGVSCIALDGDGGLWIGMASAGVSHYKNGKFTTYTTQDGLSSNDINALCIDHDRNLWIGTRNGLDRRQGSKFSSFRKIDGLHDTGVSAIFEDREGNLWVGSGAGLNRFNNTRLTPFSLPTHQGPANTQSVAQGADGSLWFGTDSGLKRLRNGVITTYTTRDGLTCNGIIDLHTAKDGAIWMIMEDGHISRFKAGVFSVVAAHTPWSLIGEDREGLVFAVDGHFSRLVEGKFIPLSIDGQSDYIFGSYLDREGILWFTTVGGLAAVRHNRVLITHKGLPLGAHVLGIADEGKGCLWVGSDKGLIRYEKGRVEVFGLSSGLPDDNLFELLVSRPGRLWIGGGRGIFTVSIADLESYRHGKLPSIPTHLFGAADGIRSFPTLEHALRTQNGDLCFLGSQGATFVSPDHLPTNAMPAPVVIEQATIDSQKLEMTNPNVIRPGKGEMEIRFAGLSYVEPEKVRFRYRLEGYDRDWVDAGSRRVAYYTLPPGSYRFRVVACNNDNVWSTGPATFRFTLQPFFYQTNWFKVACFLVSVVCLWGLVRVRMLQLRRSNQLLEARVARRTEQLHRSKEETEAMNLRLQALATTDGMTELANHRSFQEQLRVQLRSAEQNGRALGMLLIDVDHFKSYNDAFGHPAGDEVLRLVARLLRENVRPDDFVARYGGEEFAVLLPNADAEAALNVAERVREVVASHPFSHRQVTLSIGVALHTDGRADPEAFVVAADKALYTAKHAGRNRVVLAGAEPQAASPPTLVAEGPDRRQPSFPSCLTEDRRDILEALIQEPGGQAFLRMLALLDMREQETDNHSDLVARYALRLAREVIRIGIADLNPDDLRDLALGSLLHDSGETGVSEQERRILQEAADALTSFYRDPKAA